jgi:type IV secretion system protein VirB9
MRLLIALFALLVAQPALAQGRSEQVEFSPNRVYTVVGQPSILTMIQFSDSETIENVALGDSGAWQVTPNKRANMLFVKPLMARGKTNMTVITNRRRYLFDMVIGGPKVRAMYAIQFTYAEDEMIADMLARKTDLALSQAEAKPEPVLPKLNSNWKIAGDKRIAPLRIYNDDDATYIAWSQSTEIPGIFVKGTDGTEGPVNFSVRGEYLVVDGVEPQYILRMGKARTTLTNLSPPALKPVLTEPEVTPKPESTDPEMSPQLSEAMP